MYFLNVMNSFFPSFDWNFQKKKPNVTLFILYAVWIWFDIILLCVLKHTQPICFVVIAFPFVVSFNYFLLMKWKLSQTYKNNNNKNTTADRITCLLVFLILMMQIEICCNNMSKYLYVTYSSHKRSIIFNTIA